LSHTATSETTATRPSVGAALRTGIAACRRKDWHEALHYLLPLVRNPPAGLRLPGLAYSSAGHALARAERDFDGALELCRLGCEEEFFEAENWLNLAWVHLLRHDKRACLESLRRGLKIVPGHPGLRALHRRLGLRRRPVLSFLSRGNPLNVWLGKQRAVREAMRSSD
jgi:hypothetical protein